MLKYCIKNSNQIIVLTDKTINHIQKHRQIDPKAKEAGGQLFARFENNIIKVEYATGPKFIDRRTITSFRPNRFLEKREIKRMFKKNLHYIGDWHTHAEIFPCPSSIDIKSLNETFKKSNHELPWFILLIAGTSKFPQGLFVGLIKGDTELKVSRLNMMET